MGTLTLLVGLLIFCVVRYVSALSRNYYLARRTGLPILVCPVNPANLVWMVLSAKFQPELARYLPSIVYDHIEVAINGWQFRARYTVNAKLGPTFMLVTPERNELCIADPDMAHAVLSRPRHFLHLELATRIMGCFGPNVVSLNGDEWLRHRKIVAPVLNERIMREVWQESSVQAREMLDVLAGSCTSTENNARRPRPRGRETNGVIEGLRTIAINVIGSIGYGNRNSWARTSAQTDVPPGYKLTFMDTMMTIINNHIIAVFTPAKILSLAFMPPAVRRLEAARTEFPKYAREFLMKEREFLDSTKRTLMGVLVQAADDQRRQNVGLPNSSSLSLSEEEIVGNMFSFTIAGFDTTATTMAYALTALALHPQWQDWIIEEIDQVGQRDPAADYEKSFPLLTRCVAFMYEVLRLYTPILQISRRTTEPQTLVSTFIPADTVVTVSHSCIHVSPTIYGPDPLSFRPTRWVSTSAGKKDQETLIEPPRGTFLAWSGGSRSCPGMKMAQVEFVAVMREIFARWKVEAVGRAGDTPEMARERLQAIVNDSQPRITLQINKPRDVVLRWVER